ncbi:MAG: hypothetical protein L6Q37_00550 [Bdellovibrionaceae bacterium]|nr:hypothetical protein [Pseudobdellovibrionaceae bacterium]NUM57640.1 hypothetical protein [Pseudobdellovibrionaceae bacterium]
MIQVVSFFLIFFSLNLPITVNAEAYDPTNDLFYAFGSRCKGKGPINNTAFNDGSGLKQIIEDIRDDSTCKGIIGALNDVEKLNIPNLLKEPYAKDDLEFMSMRANELELALRNASISSNKDDDYIQALKSELISTKVGILKSKKLSNQEYTRRRLETIDNFHQYTNLLFSKLKESNQCLTKKPNLAAQVGAQILGLGATLASGMVGSLMLATGNLIDNFVSFYQDKNIGDKLKIITNSRIGEAVGCSFEGLAYTYCQARDVDVILAFHKNNSEKNESFPTWMDGIGSLGQDVDSYLNWASKIDSGTPAGTLGRALDKKTAFGLQNDLRMAQIDIEGILNTAIRLFANSTQKENFVRKSLNDIAAKMQPKVIYDQASNSTSYSGPFMTFFSADPTCGPYIYLYSNGKDRTRDKDDNGSTSCVSYVAKKYPNLPDLQADGVRRVSDILSEARSNVNENISDVSESNPDLVLSSIDTKFKNRRSAREFLKSALSYLNNLIQDQKSIYKKPLQKSLIDKTQKQISKVLEIIDTETDHNEKTPGASITKSKYDSIQKISDISRALIPNNDTSALPKALGEIINQDIDERIKQGELDQNLGILMRLSSNDSLSELIKYYIGLEAAKTQSRSAKELTKSNLSAFAGVFREPLKARMQKLFQESKDDPDAQESLALLCMQSLAIPEVETMDIRQYCNGKTYNSIYEKSGIKMNFNELMGKTYPEKACAVYDFYRKSYLYGLKENRSSEVQPPSSAK